MPTNGGSSRSTWFRGVAVDLPGYGKSPPAEPGLRMEDVAVACWEALDEVTDEPAILVGISTGSSTIRHMARQRPASTLALVMTGTGYRASRPPVHQRLAAYEEHGLAFRYGHILEEYSPRFRETEMGRYFGRLSPRATRRPTWPASSSCSVLNEPHPDWLDTEISVPSLIITGSLDGAHERAFAQQKRIPGCELVTIEHAGHACNMEKPWEWDAHFLAFLAKHGLFEGEARLAER